MDRASGHQKLDLGCKGRMGRTAFEPNLCQMLDGPINCVPWFGREVREWPLGLVSGYQQQMRCCYKLTIVLSSNFLWFGWAAVNCLRVPQSAGESCQLGPKLDDNPRFAFR